MTKIGQLIAIAGLLSTAAAIPAHAADITYTGFQQLGSIAADYSITTDGAIGDLSYSDFTSYVVTLTDSVSSVTFGGTEPDIFSNVLAAPASLSFDDPTAELVFADFGSGSLIAELSLYPNGSAGYIADNSGNRQGFGSPAIIFATTAAAAVPEPATWAMMIVGLGGVGFAMRRRQKVRTNFRFA